MKSKRLLVFAHMMKTAGTSLSRDFIAYYGPKMHIVPGGLQMNDVAYDQKDFLKDYTKSNGNLNLMVGHPLRPYKAFEIPEVELVWFTFLRDPKSRYVSHFLHNYEWSNHFSIPRYKSMKSHSVQEWEKIEGYANYQTKFIAGESNAEKAIDIINEKLHWVGITEEFDQGVMSLKHHLGLRGFSSAPVVRNSSLAGKRQKSEILETDGDFLESINQEDQKLYDYVKSEIWPKFKIDSDRKDEDRSISGFQRELNMFLFQLKRQTTYKTSNLTLKNLVRFYNRWYRK